MSRAFQVDWQGTKEDGPVFRVGHDFGVTEAAELRERLPLGIGDAGGLGRRLGRRRRRGGRRRVRAGHETEQQERLEKRMRRSPTRAHERFVPGLWSYPRRGPRRNDRMRRRCVSGATSRTPSVQERPEGGAFTPAAAGRRARPRA